MSSMGGNGVKSEYMGVPTMGFAKPWDMIPSDVGGGCVVEGPFKKYLFHFTFHLLFSTLKPFFSSNKFDKDDLV
jgi:hypothetical protein